MNEITPNTVFVENDAIFNLEVLTSAARQNQVDESLIGFIEKTFTNPEIAKLITETKLTQPTEFSRKFNGLAFEWHFEGIGFEITFLDIYREPQIHTATKDLDSDSYNKPYLASGEEGIIDLLYIIECYRKQELRKKAKLQ